MKLIQRRITTVTASLLLGTASLLFFTTGSANAAEEDTATGPEDTVESVTIEAVTTDTTGRFVSKTVQNATGDAEIEALAADSGTSSASGCRKVTVTNKTNSTLGSLLYTFKTWTNWCWVRSTDNISSVTTGWDWISDDICWSWDEIKKKDAHYYDWASGYAPKSGYYHLRMGHTEFTCTGKIPALNKYPRNIIRSHSNGTWTWDTSDG